MLLTLYPQDSLVDTNWAEIADHIETIEELYEVSAGEMASANLTCMPCEVRDAFRVIFS